jgi:cytochrome c biogenesis protein CcmG, thiol:disulfide interchange protein DsbE
MSVTRRTWLVAATWASPALTSTAATRMGEAAVLTGEQLPDLAGQLRSLHDPRSAATWVDFWASWCTPCRLSFPWMNQLHERLGPRGLRIVAVNLDARRADAERFLAQHPAQFEVLFDAEGRLAARLQLKAMPSSLLLDGSGRESWRHAGFRAGEAAALETRLAAALPPTRP